MNTILWVLITGARWIDAPTGPRWAPRSTAHEWLGKWQQSGVLERVLSLLLDKAESLKLTGFDRVKIDGFFSQGRGGGEEVAYGYKGKGVTNHLLVDYRGNPVGVKSTAANVSEQDQVLPLLEKVEKFLRALIAKGVTPILEADKGYDSRILRINVLLARVFPWIPYRGKKKQKGVRYLEKCRWQVERGISWLQRKFRRVNIRWERKMVYWTGSETQAMIVYDVEIPGLAKDLRAASLLSFQEGLISKIELIYDARCLMEKKEEAMST